MKNPLLLILTLIGSSLTLGCGDPSVKDVCGKCSGVALSACEGAYEECKATPRCSLKDLQDVYALACGSSFGLSEDDADGGL
jgi:hypothetical protein